MTDTYEYTANDLAVYPLCPGRGGGPYGESLDAFLEALDEDELPVAKIIGYSCAVGYGGHFFEVLEDSAEGAIMRDLAELLAPKYKLEVDNAYYMLTLIRDEFARRLREGENKIIEQWEREGWYVTVQKLTPDHCPVCGKYITDDMDDGGCEDPSGQRWCVVHALDQLSIYWRNR